MAEDSIRACVGPHDEHVRRATMGHRNSRLPIVLHDGHEPTLLQRWRDCSHRLRNPRRHHALLLGQCPVVNGEPVQLGQTSRPIRDIHNITRANQRHTCWHVIGRYTRDCPIRSNGCRGGMACLSSSDKPSLAHRNRNFHHNTRLALRSRNDTLLVVPRLWPRSGILQRGPPGTCATTFRSILPRLLPGDPLSGSSGCLRHPSNNRHGRS